MSDKEIDVRVTANTADLKRGMSEAPNTVEQATSRMRGSFRKMQDETRSTLQNMRNDISSQVSGMAGPMSGLVDVLGTVRGGFIAVAAAAATLAFSRSVNEAAQMTESAMDLSRSMGITTNEASVLQAALEDVGASPGEFEGAAKGLSRQLRANESDMKALGLATRDAQGNLRPMTDLVLDSVGILNQYREGADRAIASQTLFGRGVDASSKLLLLNRDTLEENRAAVEDLGLMVGENGVEAWKDYDAATDRAGLSIKGMVKAVGQSLMPILTDLIGLFNSIMPAAIVVVRGALSGLTATFLAVRNGVVVLWETINAMVITVAEPIRALAEAISRAAGGDFAGAAESIKGIGGNIAGAWERAMTRIADSSAKTAKQIKGLFVPDAAAAQGGSSGDLTSPEESDKKKDKKEKSKKEQGPVDVFENGSFITSDKGTVDFIKKQFDAVNSLQGEMVREADKAAKEMADAQKKSAEQRTQVEILWSQNAALSQLAVVDAASASAQQQYDLGVLTYQELLTKEEEFENQRNQIRLQALTERLALIDPERDPVTYAQVLITIEELERQHQARIGEIRRQTVLEQTSSMGAVMQSLEQGLLRLGNSMLTNWRNVGNALRSVLASIGQTIIQEVILKPLVAKVAAWAKERLLTMAGIGAKAAGAGAGAAESQASIPYIGPILAIAAMAAVFAGVMGMSSKVPSAAGGFDIPRGMNPLTQLHEKEMVLPAKHADVIRSLGEGGGEGGGSFSPNISITAMDASGVRDFLMTNQAALVEALRNAHRNGMR
ncbi:MAG: hypothetical protein Q8M84_03145 [Thiobacillus sp.]|nr:hypothetical protein [Thiobacillus sp.]